MATSELYILNQETSTLRIFYEQKLILASFEGQGGGEGCHSLGKPKFDGYCFLRKSLMAVVSMKNKLPAVLLHKKT